MVNEILSPPAFVAFSAVLMGAALVWALLKSRAEKLDATKKAFEFQVVHLENEVQRLSTVPPPSFVPEKSSQRATLPPSSIYPEIVRRSTHPEPLEELFDTVMSVRDEELMRRSLLPPEPGSPATVIPKPPRLPSTR